MDRSRKNLTYRLQNIPSESASHDALKALFSGEDADYVKIKSLAPAIDNLEGKDGDGDWVATVYFYPSDPTRELSIARSSDIDVDKDFIGFTPLYVPPNGPIAADIIAITGLAGHAYGSWAHSAEHMWLRDYLPRDAPNARILIYGYPSQLQGSMSNSIIADHTTTFVHRLTDMREDGGASFFPSSALTDIGSMGVNSSRLPVRAIVFLAAPHRGLNINALQTLVKQKPTETLVMELKAGSPTLTDLNNRFAHFARDINILTCYETIMTKTVIEVDGMWKREGEAVMMVSSDSAHQFYSNERPIAVDKNHSEIAKIKRGENGIYPSIKSIIKRALLTNATIVASAEAIPVHKSVREKTSSRARGDSHRVQRNTTKNQTTEKVMESYNQAQESITEDGPSVGGKESPYLTSPVSKGEVLLEPNRVFSLDVKSTTQNEILSEINPSSQLAQESFAEEETLLQVDGSSSPTIKSSPDAPIQASEATKTSPDSLTRASTYTADSTSTSVPEETEDQMPNKHLSLSRSVSKTENNAVPQNIADVVDTTENMEFPDEKVKAVSEGRSAQSVRSTLPVNDDDSDLVKALKAFDSSAVEELASNPVNLLKKGQDGSQPLHIAAYLGFEAGVEILLKKRVPTNERDSKNFTPLMIAAKQNDLSIVDLLLQHGADVRATGGESKSTPLHVVAWYNSCQEIIELLIRMKADVNSQDKWGRTPLSVAVWEGHHNIAAILMKAGGDPNKGDNDGISPLMYTAFRGHLKIIENLLQYDANLNARTIGEGFNTKVGDLNPIAWNLLFAGSGAFLFAAAGNQLEVIRFLLQRGEDVNQRSIKGFTALHIAAKLGFQDICQELLDNKANPKLEAISKNDGPDCTPLHLAAGHNHQEILVKLIKVGFLDSKNSRWGPLHVALWHSHAEAARLLIEGGCGLESEAAYIRGVYAADVRPLYMAAQAGLLPIVKLLLEKGVNPGSWHAGGILSWKRLTCKNDVTPNRQKEIINTLREHEKKWKK